MKKRNLIAFATISLFSLLSTSCINMFNNKQEEKEEPEVECDPMFEDCDEKSEKIELAKDTNASYTFDSSVSNANGSVSYEIFIRSFYDSNGDGVGDLNGIKAKLPYLKEMGIKNLWLTPFNKTDTYHGYDIKDYYDIESDIGSLNDLKSLISEAKKNNITITMDLVLNHSSRSHPWFIQSYEDYKNGKTGADSKASWYNWSTKMENGGYHRYGDYFYEGNFGDNMPDFNLSNESFKKEVKNILKYYIDLGINSFRLDAVKFYDKFDGTIAFLDYLKETATSYDENATFVGECWDIKYNVQDYFTSKCDSFFRFHGSIDGFGGDMISSYATKSTNGNNFGSNYQSDMEAVHANNPNGNYGNFLSNHDQDRISKLLSGDSYKLASSVMMLLPGTPYIYYGEEIALKGVRGTSPDDGTDVKRRLPMIWSESDKTGECEFPEKNKSYLGIGDQVKEGALDLLNTNYSLTNHYKKVINLRNKYYFINNANFTNLTRSIDSSNKNLLAYKLEKGSDKIIVCHNSSEDNIKVKISDYSTKILDSVNTTKQISKIEDGYLCLAAKSSVILDVK